MIRLCVYVGGAPSTQRLKTGFYPAGLRVHSTNTWHFFGGAKSQNDTWVKIWESLSKPENKVSKSEKVY
jgi:hypothetical protein